MPRIVILAFAMSLSCAIARAETVEQAVARLEKFSIEKTKDPLGDLAFWELSASIAAEQGNQVIAPIMARAETWKGEEALLYTPVLAFLPRQETILNLKKYQAGRSKYARLYAGEFLVELNRSGLQESIEKSRMISTRPPPLKLYSIIEGVDVLLKDEVGAMLINDGTQEHPIPRYIVAINGSRTVVDTRDLEIFRQALHSLPHKAEAFFYDSCTMPRSYGLTGPQEKEFNRSFELAGIALRKDIRRITCYCPRVDTSEQPTTTANTPADSAPQLQKTMRPTSIPNTVDYVETPSLDLPKSKAFFSALLGWHFTEYGPEYLDYSDGRTTGGFYRSEKVSSTATGSTIAVIYTERLEELRDRAKALGATITRDIFSFPGGRRFHFTEPGGSEFAIWSDK